MKSKYIVCYTSPNQRVVSVKKTLSDKEHIYSICNVSATMDAAKHLSDRAFKLFIRLMLHEDGFTFALSPAEISSNIGMSDDRYRNAVKELIDKGYLRKNPEKKNYYTIYEAPQIDCSPVALSAQKQEDANAEAAESTCEKEEISRQKALGNPVCKQSSKMHTFSPANAHFFTASF